MWSRRPLTVGGVHGPKTGGVLEDIRGVKISLYAMQMIICKKQLNFRIPYFRPSFAVPPGADAPSPPVPPPLVGLGPCVSIVCWVGLGEEKWTHVHLWMAPFFIWSKVSQCS